ncbi:MAG: hypothetical protein GY810_19510 [Aureispira sp.]|nr:hypothetical protein [Aureispira sp.]
MNKLILLVTLLCVSTWTMAQKKGTPVYLEKAMDVKNMKKLTDKLQRLYYQRIGHFSNIATAEDNGEKEQDIIGVPIFPQRGGEYWIYTEWFLRSYPDNPLGHRIEHITRIDRETILIEAYDLKDSEAYYNEWKKAEPFSGLNKVDLIRKEACDQKIKIIDKQNAVFQTVDKSEEDMCNVAFGNGIEYVREKFTSTDEKSTFNVYFYDVNKKFVKDLDADGLIMERLNPKRKGYVNLAEED